MGIYGPIQQVISMAKRQWNHRETGTNIKSVIQGLKEECMLVRQIIKRIVFQIEITSITMAYILEQVCYRLKRKDIQMDRAWKSRWKEAKRKPDRWAKVSVGGGRC